MRNAEVKYEDAKLRRRAAARDLESIEAYIQHIQNDIDMLRRNLDR